VVILSLAFLAGLILNVMPCVLPVIGLKIMSFVQQAGGSRGEILSLNLWFSFGLMAVFWILASVAVFAKLGWGEHFGDVRFLVTMIGIVFAFGLSFLGVWEIPIPGFVGGSTMQGVAQKEGPIGAFGKGVLSTVLATPCAGPLLVPAVSWAAAQPAGLTYLTFTSIGLGMASPYLLIGAFPRLIRVLPKPGAWMDTFKQIMGFLLMGTVVFLFNSLASEWVIPTLTLLLGIGIACWWIGRISVSAGLTQKLVGWSWAGVLIALAGYVGFVTLASANRLEWQPFSRVTLDRYLEEGYTVLVDFTADW
jgi:thiol:disulfide interchange protein